MFTLCPRCQSVHRLSAAALRKASGRIQCPQCQHRFNALDHLSDDYPDRRRGQQEQRKETDALTLQQAVREDLLVRVGPHPSVPATRAWQGLLVILVLVTVANLGWALRGHIPIESALGQQLGRWGVAQFLPPEPFRDASGIHLISRDIHAHPSRPGVLVLSATFINLADQAQPYPEMRLNMLNSEGQALAARSFSPSEYLSTSATRESLLNPDQQVPFLLEFADPGEKAVGFELLFH